MFLQRRSRLSRLTAKVRACREACPGHYVRVSAFDARRGVESVRLSFLVNRPADEPGFALERAETQGRNVRYTTHSYAARKPTGQRY